MILLIHAVLTGHLGLASPQLAAMDSREACKADYQTFCAGVEPGGGRIKACLRQNHANLSAACRAALASASPRS